MSRNALGKGLKALIPEPEPPPAAPGAVPSATPTASAAAPALAVSASEPLHQVDIDLIDPSPYQTRTHFREESLEGLARSIHASGIIQPVVVRRRGNRFQLIAGERRWRAAQRAGLQRVPAVIREVSEEAALEMTLVENLQREDLNPIEQASAFDRLMSEFHLTQEEVAERTGKDRTTIANALRLLKLEPNIQKLLAEGHISAGHGRALLAIADANLRYALSQRAAHGQITVRQLEKLALRKISEAIPAATPKERPLDPNTRAAIEELQQTYGTRVHLHPPRGSRPGELIFEYYIERDLTRLYDQLMNR